MKLLEWSVESWLNSHLDSLSGRDPALRKAKLTVMCAKCQQM